MNFGPLLIQATPEAAEPTLRGLEAIQAVDGFTVALVGMSVVFSALLLLFFLMIGLKRVLEPPPKAQVEAGSTAAIEQQAELAQEVEGLSPQLVAAIATAIRLEQQRQAAYAQAPAPGVASGWTVARSLQWAAHQQIFLRPRR